MKHFFFGTVLGNVWAYVLVIFQLRARGWWNLSASRSSTSRVLKYSYNPALNLSFSHDHHKDWSSKTSREELSYVQTTRISSTNTGMYLLRYILSSVCAFIGCTYNRTIGFKEWIFGPDSSSFHGRIWPSLFMMGARRRWLWPNTICGQSSCRCY